MPSDALEEILRGFLVEKACVDVAIVQLAEREQRSQRHAPVAAAERTVHQQSEKECRDFVRKRSVRLAAEHHDLRPLHAVEKSERGIDHARMGLVAAELHADRAMKLDDVLNGQVTDAAVSR